MGGGYRWRKTISGEDRSIPRKEKAQAASDSPNIGI
jgi:hypothetical protein